MAWTIKIRLRKLWFWLAGLLPVGAMFVLLIAYSGIYNVAASAGHPDWLDWFFSLGKRRSVVINSKLVQPPELNLNELVPLGAAHFQGGCATCHKTPDQSMNPVYDQMLPPPPDLQINAPLWTRRQLFWIVRHGIQFTGMPAWSGHDRDDEVWAVVAFLEALPDMKSDDYTNYAGGKNRGGQSIDFPANAFAVTGKPKINISACNRCHDTGDEPPTSPYVPYLGGQDKTYIKRALHEYRSDTRQSGFMEPIAVELDDGRIDSLAEYYAALPAPSMKPTSKSSQEAIEVGRQLAEHGDLRRKIPACLSCHGAGKRPGYPHLGGQSEQYIGEQLRLLHRGVRAKTTHGAIMTAIAKRLDENQIAAAAAFFSSQSSTSAEDMRR